MKKLASRMTVPEHCISGRPVVTHLTSTRLRDVILYNKEYEPALYEKMKGSIEALSPFIPAKDNADNALPDVFISRQDWEIPVTPLTIRWSYSTPKAKEATVLVGLPETQYFLSDLEYKFGYYVLMNRWQVPVIQKWIAEYHEKAISNPNGQKTTFFLFESQ